MKNKIFYGIFDERGWNDVDEAICYSACNDLEEVRAEKDMWNGECPVFELGGGKQAKLLGALKDI